MKYITITKGCIAITYAVLDITTDSLIEHAGGKLKFMRLIGILSLQINDHAVLEEDENMNFTFELALLEAVTAGHNEAVEFLLQLETVNINHTNEEGKTALMLASERGHEDIVHSLLSAGANVNLQDNNGRTALMRVSEHNYISIINLIKACGPMIDDQQSCLLFAKYLKPLADWKPFALCLPGITQSHVNIIDRRKRNAHLKKVALHKKWLQVNPQALWRDVITALEICHEDEVAETVKHQVTQSSSHTDDNMEVIISDETGKPQTKSSSYTYIMYALIN